MSRLTIAVTGDFGPKRSHDKMEHWVRKNGGMFSKNINKTVTHLICSKEEYKKNSAMGILFKSRIMVGLLTSVNSAASQGDQEARNRELRLVRRLVDAEKTFERAGLSHGSSCQRNCSEEATKESQKRSEHSGRQYAILSSPFSSSLSTQKLTRLQ